MRTTTTNTTTTDTTPTKTDAVLHAIGRELRTGRVDDALALGRLLNYPSNRNRGLVKATDPTNNVVGHRTGLNWPVDVYRDGAFFGRFYSTLNAEAVRRSFAAGDKESIWVVLD